MALTDKLPTAYHLLPTAYLKSSTKHPTAGRDA